MGRGLDGYLLPSLALCGFQSPPRTSRKIPVAHGEWETPLPIPNRAVKPLCADGTWGATPWESRSPPVLLYIDARARPPRRARVVVAGDSLVFSEFAGALRGMSAPGIRRGRGSTFQDSVCPACGTRWYSTRSGSVSANASLVSIGTTSSSVPWKSRIGRRNSSLCEIASRLCQSGSTRADDGPLDRSCEDARKAHLGGMELEHLAPVEDRSVEDQCRCPGCEGRALDELGDDRTTHRVPDQNQAPGSMVERVAGGGLEVPPLGSAEVVESVGALRGRRGHPGR